MSDINSSESALSNSDVAGHGWSAGNPVYYGDACVGVYVGVDPFDSSIAVIALSTEYSDRWSAAYISLEFNAITKYNESQEIRDSAVSQLASALQGFTSDQIISVMVDSGICIEDLKEQIVIAKKDLD